MQFKRWLFSLASIGTMLIALTPSHAAVTISANATGNATVGNVTYPNTITNGDFVIAGNAIATNVGNGVDEATEWDFDFTGDSDFAAFDVSSPLASAELTLTLTPYDRLISTDTVNIDGLEPILTSIIQGLPNDQQPHTIEIELLGFYTSDEILAALTTGTPGVISMRYQDDAILTYAQLDLTTADLPEPSTFFTFAGVLGMGLIGYGRRRRT